MIESWVQSELFLHMEATKHVSEHLNLPSALVFLQNKVSIWRPHLQYYENNCKNQNECSKTDTLQNRIE